MGNGLVFLFPWKHVKNKTKQTHTPLTLAPQTLLLLLFPTRGWLTWSNKNLILSRKTHRAFI